MQELVIHSLQFAREEQQRVGHIAVSELSRLTDTSDVTPVVVEPVGERGSLSYQIAGGLDGLGRPQLHLKVSGTVSLQCQRCLGALAHHLNIDAILRLVPAETLEAGQDGEALTDPDEPDCIAASNELDLMALVEDEVLLALPPYPRHEDAACGGGDGGGVGNMAAVKKHQGSQVFNAGNNVNSAFSVLSTLKTLK